MRRARLSVETFKAMIAADAKPNVITYNTVMEALVASAQWSLAVETLAREEVEGALVVDRAEGSVDLHGLTVPVALVAVVAKMQRLQQSRGRRGLVIIPGWKKITARRASRRSSWWCCGF